MINLCTTTTVRRIHVIITVIALLLMSNGCTDFKRAFNITSIDEDGNEAGRDFDLPAKKLLTYGMEDYNVGKYFSAIGFFEEIINRYPFSPEATLAELKAADCSYHLNRFLEALLLYEEFENRHPTNESIPYVMYQKSMCHYKQIDRIDRDTAGAEKAILHFKQLLRAYPNSPYSAEARARISAATEFLANHEYFVVEYYVRAAKYDQAKVRIQYLLATYPMTEIAPKANKLLSLIESGTPPKSKLTSWFPKMELPDWSLFGSKDEEDSVAAPVKK